MIVNEDKTMDKINKNLKIIDSLLMENGFYKYISKVVNIEDGISQLYDNLKQLQQENARLKEIENKLNFIKNRKNQGASQENINKMAIEFVNSYLKEVE